MGNTSPNPIREKWRKFTSAVHKWGPVGTLKRGAALLGVAGLAVSGLALPQTIAAAAGGGGVSSTGVSSVWWDNENHPTGSGLQSMYNLMASVGWTWGGGHMTPHMGEVAEGACTVALQRASSRGGYGSDISKSRVVGLLVADVATNSGGVKNDALDAKSKFYDEANAWLNGTGDWAGSGASAGFTGDSRGDMGNGQTYMNFAGTTLVADGMQDISGNLASVICIAFNETEPTDPSYPLTVTTAASHGDFAQVGSTATVSDSITTSNGGSSIAENLNATVTLHVDSLEGQNAYSASKAVTLPNNGTTASPGFTPADFGWTSWAAAGKYWFDVIVPQQGKMSAGVDTADREAAESWDVAPKPPNKIITDPGDGSQLTNKNQLAAGQWYDAKVTAPMNGYKTSMTIRDTVNTDKVWIGAETADNSSKVTVTGPDGKATPATVKIDRTQAGKVSVTATVAPVPMPL
jgi:hypothetical protein